MSTTVSTTPVTLNDGTAAIVHIGNTGDPGKRVTVTWGANSQTLDPGFSADIKPAGSPVAAVTATGSTTLTVDLTGVPPSSGSGGGGGSTVVADGAGNLTINGTTYALSTDAELASAIAALSGTFAPLASPALTGTPTVNGSAVATTASASGSAAGLAIVFGG